MSSPSALRISLLVALCLSSVAGAVERFPPPQFEQEYEMPHPTTPGPRELFFEYLDVGVLIIALGVVAYLVHKKRSRKAVFAAVVFSLLYFGFWRLGCVCSIGAVQNVSLAMSDSTYILPAAVLLFFIIPLVSTLFHGRTFCAAVCPLGAIQDVVLWKPVRVPGWLESGLRTLAYVYLAAAVLFVVTGSAFIICRYDPFISFFRLSGNLNILVFGGCLLVIGMFVGRPYCRFLCPYGVVLRQCSRLSRKRVSITPDECIQCRLCEDACPFGAINKPTVNWPAREYARSKQLLTIGIVSLPVLVLLLGWLGSLLSPVTARAHATVRLAERVQLENEGKVQGTTDASDAFRATGRTTSDLYAEAKDIRADFRFGGWFAGGFIGLIIALKFIKSGIWYKRTDYEADPAGCFACGRCFEYCPREHLRLQKEREETGKNL